MARTCMFCGGKVTTAEDAWPRCAIQLARNFSPQFRIEITRSSGITETWGGKGRSSYLKVNYLCKRRCNNGWMSDLETAVRPLVGAMITDQPVPLSITDQVAISAWAVKTAMVFECMKEDRQWFYSQEDRDHLRADLSLPENTGVWLGRQQASWAGFAEGKKLSGGTSPEGPALGDS